MIAVLVAIFVAIFSHLVAIPVPLVAILVSIPGSSVVVIPAVITVMVVCVMTVGCIALIVAESRILAEASLPDTFGYYIQPDILRIWLRRKNYFFSERIGARSQHSAAVPRASSA